MTSTTNEHPPPGEHQHPDPTRSGAPAGFYAQHGKRALDLCIGVPALVLAVPVLAAASGVLRLSIGGSVIHRQVRVGRNGTNFEMVKLRTMHHSRRQAELPYSGPDRRVSHKVAHDPRHTRVGRWFRKFSLDELPQLVHVVRGQMSLVGPRPELSALVDQYGLRDHPRHLVRPGLTGSWQVGRRASHVPLHECFDDDLEYLAGITLVGDLKIVWRTVGAVVHGTGN